jgi:hypothetical protein
VLIRSRWYGSISATTSGPRNSERHRLRVGVEEHEPGERVDRNLHEAQLILVERAGEVGARDAAQLALEVEVPEVVRAGEPLVVALAGAQRIASVGARVDDAADDVVVAAGDDVRLVENAVFEPVAGVRQVALTPHHLPHLHPDVLTLARCPVGGRVAVGRNIQPQGGEVDVGQPWCRLDPFP